MTSRESLFSRIIAIVGVTSLVTVSTALSEEPFCIDCTGTESTFDPAADSLTQSVVAAALCCEKGRSCYQVNYVPEDPPNHYLGGTPTTPKLVKASSATKFSVTLKQKPTQEEANARIQKEADTACFKVATSACGNQSIICADPNQPGCKVYYWGVGEIVGGNASIVLSEGKYKISAKFTCKPKQMGRTDAGVTDPPTDRVYQCACGGETFGP